MSSSATNPSDAKKSASAVDNTPNNASPLSKGKTKDQLMEDDDEEEEEEEEEEMGSDEEASDEEAEEDFEEIDPNAIMPQGRRTRGIKVDYSSKEAREKAGLQSGDEDSDDDVDMKD